VRELDGMDVDRRIARLHEAGLDVRKQGFTMWQTARAALLGAIGGEVDLVLEDAAGETVELTLERRARNVTAQDVGASMPTFFMAFESRDIERDGRRYGYIAFSNWFFSVVKPINDAVERMRRADGIVIDLRGNTGGVAAMTMGTAGHFVRERETLGKMLMRESQVNFQITPQTVNTAGEVVEPFSGPLAILVDETTGSASEVFAGGLQSLGRVRVFGATSAGAVLPAMPTRLPNGDTLLHALGDFETSTGVRLEGVGVVPDVPVARTREGLLEGRDEQLEAALEWLDRAPAEQEH
jgi:carboxyl-terminal processing protease